MYYDLPNNGCNYLSNSSNLTNYYNGVATTYVLTEGQLIRTRTTNYSSIPTGTICLGDSTIPYKSDLIVEWQVWSIILCALIGVLLYKTIGRVLGR